MSLIVSIILEQLDLLAHILNYLSPLDVGRVDSVLTSKRLRKTFLSVLKRPGFCLHDIVPFSDDQAQGYLCWLCAREATTCNIVVPMNRYDGEDAIRDFGARLAQYIVKCTRGFESTKTITFYCSEVQDSFVEELALKCAVRSQTLQDICDNNSTESWDTIRWNEDTTPSTESWCTFFDQSFTEITSAVSSGNHNKITLSSIKLHDATDQNVIQLVQMCNGLQCLDISNSRSVTDSAIVALVHSCPALLSLKISSCWFLTDASVEALAARCHGLRTLSMGDLQISDKSLLALATGCPLETVDVSGCTLLTDAGIGALAECPGLLSLDVSEVAITNVSLLALSKERRLVHTLSMRHCSGVTDFGVGAVAAACPRLEFVDVRRCAGVTDASLESFSAHCLGLQSLLWEGSNITERAVEGWRGLQDSQVVST